MIGLNTKIWSFIKIVITAILFLLPSISTATDIITSKKISSNNLTKERLSSIYLGRMRNWPDGQAIKVVMFSHFDSKQRKFCREVLSLSPRYVRQAWNQLTYSGFSNGPIIVSSEEEMIKMVSRTPGAIGYIDTTSSKEGIYVINVSE